MKKPPLTAIVFVCGASTMALELTGSRIVAPYVGTSIYVWTNLIGVILGFMSLGYAWGGRLADRRPDASLLSLVVFAAALWTAGLAVFHDPVLALVSSLVRDVRIGAFAAAVLLFSAPSVLLGMVVPFAVRLATRSVDSAATTAGSLYAWSTLGSIAGTFLAGYVLLSYFGNTLVLLLIAAALAVAAGLAQAGRGKTLALVLLLSAAGLSGPLAEAVHGKELVDVNTPYNRVWVYDLPSKIRLMKINDEYSSMRSLEHDDLVAPYTRYYRLGGHFVPKLKKALMLGGAAYSYPQDFLRHYPDGAMDVVEIDPGVTALARKYFGLADDPRLRIFHEDARTFLNRNREKYDVVFSDTFRSSSIPPHLTTEEAMGRVYDSLSDDGAFIGNTISSVEGDSGRFLRAEVATLKKRFKQVYLFPVQNRDNPKEVQNVLVVALKSARVPKFYSSDPEIHEYLQHLWIGDLADALPLTDDFAPVERYSFSATGEIDQLESPVLRHWKKMLGFAARD